MIQVVKFEELVFRKNNRIGIFQARATFTNGSSVSVIFGEGCYGDGHDIEIKGFPHKYGDEHTFRPPKSHLELYSYEAFFSDEEDPRPRQNIAQLQEEFNLRIISESDTDNWIRVK